MNKFPVLIGAALLLYGCNSLITTPPENIDTERLAACTIVGSVFETLPFAEWPKKYHETVAKVIEAHMKSIEDTKTTELQCTASDYASLVKPIPELTELAKTLPPWKDPLKLSKLSETELGPVLLEYLRVYECSLSERRNFLSTIVAKEFATAPTTAPNTLQQRIDYNETTDEQRRIIDYETAIARTTLNKTLIIVGGQDRLRPLGLDIECLKRVSLDIRNIMGLLSQASACMPRIRDARGSLRDLPELPPPPPST